jgi:arylsulfatase A
MTRRDFLKAAGGATLARPLAASPPKPNIVLILADDLGYECLNCYGGTSYKTPHLDRLASRGVRFTHAYAQPLCTPTRVQLMTGQYNFRNWKAFGILDPKQKTFGHSMQEAGYKTCIAGKWQLYSYNPPDFEPEWRGKGMDVRRAGFDEHCAWHAFETEDKGSRYADPTVFENGTLHQDLKGRYGEDVFIDFIARFMEKHRDNPFFVYYPMALTHGPFNPTPKSKDWAKGNRLKNDPAYFADMVEYMDECVNRVVEHTARLGIRERTLILFYSDNGTPRQIRSRMGDKIIQGGKGLMTDAGTRVPLIASWEGTAPQGRVLEDLVDSTDFLPTMLEAAGARVPRNVPMDGRSFLPQLRGERGNPREWIYSWHDPRPGWDKEPYRLEIFARDQRYKLYSDGRFYDVPNDVLEQKPLPPGQGGPAAAAARAKLRAVLDKMKRLGAPQPS